MGAGVLVGTDVAAGTTGNVGTTGGRVNCPGARVDVLFTRVPGNGGEDVFGRGVPAIAVRARGFAVLVGGGVLVAGCAGRAVAPSAGGGAPGTNVARGMIVLFTGMTVGTSVPRGMMIAVAGTGLLVEAAATGV